MIARLVDRRDALDDLAVAGNDVAGHAEHEIAAAERLRRCDHELSLVRSVAGASSRLAVVCVRDLRSVSACALPRPSAIASAKFAKSTVNQSQSAIWSVKPMSPRPLDESRTSTTVVSTLPTSTTNMTGFRTMWRGSSFANASRIARRTIGGSKSGRLLRGHVRTASRAHRECSTIGPSASAGKNVSAPTIRIDADEQRRRTAAPVTGNVPAVSGAIFFSARKPAEREHRHDHREAADERRRAPSIVL